MTEIPAEIIICATPDDFARIGAEWIVSAAERAITDKGRFTLGLSGGSTPLPIFDRLTEPEWRAQASWQQTDVFWCDERCVPPDDPMSNFGDAWRHLFSRVDIPPENLHRIAGEDPDHEAVAARYGAELPARFDLLVLGTGEDGHTASLFPHSPLLFERIRHAAVVTDSPKPPSCRITITPPVIECAHHVLMLATGAEKAHAVAAALSVPFPIDEIPARLARWGTWLLDPVAATKIPLHVQDLLNP